MLKRRYNDKVGRFKGFGLSRVDVVALESFILRAFESIFSTNQIMMHGCAVAVVEFVRQRGIRADSRGDTQLHNEYVLFRNFRDYVFLNVMYFTLQEVRIFRRSRSRTAPCARFCYSYLLFHALLTFYAACPSPVEPPLKYHVENNSLSNSHFSLRGWFRRNMHETEASEVKWKKSDDAMKNLATRKIFFSLFFSPMKWYVSSNCVGFCFVAWAFFHRYTCLKTACRNINYCDYNDIRVMDVWKLRILLQFFTDVREKFVQDTCTLHFVIYYSLHPSRIFA